MQIDFSTLDSEQHYKLISNSIYPRPIAWIVTEDDGIVNIAPFSFLRKFNPNTEDTTVSVSDPNLGSGIYTVRINGRNSEAYEKMIVR